jgi:OOP family OmpA-OmpF porin
MNHKLYRLLVAAGLTLTMACAGAATMAGSELGVLLGGGVADKHLVGGKNDRVNPLIGLRYGKRIGERFNFFGDLTYGQYDGDRLGVGDSKVATARGGVEWLFAKQPKYDWFLSGAVGGMKVNTDQGPDFTRPMASLGLGQAWEFGVNDAIRWEVRADQELSKTRLPSKSLTNFQALVGYSWGLGAPLDSDGDGVADRIDQCPSTPKGAKVDTKGCPLDGDHDGVYDGLDQCPTTPAGVKVDVKGCPLDSDGDGVTDDIDQCPDTPKGDAVDAKGCSLPKDSDGDGITDDKDACPTVAAPNTPDGCPPKPEPVAEAPAPHKLVLVGIHFDTDSFHIRSESLPKLEDAVDKLKKWDDAKIEVAGYTDSRYTAAYNLQLSKRRASAVRSYLTSKGIDPARLVAVGYGESNPVASNKTKEGRFQNRRVEMTPMK